MPSSSCAASSSMCCPKASSASAATDCCLIATENNCCPWRERCSLNRDAILSRRRPCPTAHPGTVPAAEKPCTSDSATPQQNFTSLASILHDCSYQLRPTACSMHVLAAVCVPPNTQPRRHAASQLRTAPSLITEPSPD